MIFVLSKVSVHWNIEKHDSVTVLENLAMYLSFKSKLRRFDHPAPNVVPIQKREATGYFTPDSPS